MNRIIAVDIRSQRGVVAARQRARVIAGLLGFDAQDQTRIATAVSEIARNAIEYGKGGAAQFFVTGEATPQTLLIRIADHGPGIANLQDLLDGNFESQTGMGLGILGSRRLMDRFEIQSAPGAGTTVSLYKSLPRNRGLLTSRDLGRIAGELSSCEPGTASDEIEIQNRELLAAFNQLRERSEELERVNHELEDTNRGVVALYAELDEKANHLRRVDELKSKFLSNMSHEFRTPVFSTVSLCRMLLEQDDGQLTAEQELQVRLILKAQEGLAELVNDLLDLAKVEAGKTSVSTVLFKVEDLFSALRGMFRPLMVGDGAALIFEEPANVPEMLSDEGKVSQILRNFISNALKFTEKGEVRVSARYDYGSDHMILSVADTGIGIAVEDQARIFEEFGQIESKMQRKVKGTGLGLPLSRRLAELLGGVVYVASQPGEGSTFTAEIPRAYSRSRPAELPAAVSQGANGRTEKILIIDDEDVSRYITKQFFPASRYRIIECGDGAEGIEKARRELPDAILLDLIMPGMSGFEALDQLKSDPLTAKIPVMIHTSKPLTEEDRSRLGSARAILSKGDSPGEVAERIRQLLRDRTNG